MNRNPWQRPSHGHDGELKAIAGGWEVLTDREWYEQLSTLERLFLQACLGSDRLHELLSYATGFLNGNEEPTVLFKPKQSRGAA